MIKDVIIHNATTKSRVNAGHQKSDLDYAVRGIPRPGARVRPAIRPGGSTRGYGTGSGGRVRASITNEKARAPGAVTRAAMSRLQTQKSPAGLRLPGFQKTTSS